MLCGAEAKVFEVFADEAFDEEEEGWDDLLEVGNQLFLYQRGNPLPSSQQIHLLRVLIIKIQLVLHHCHHNQYQLLKILLKILNSHTAGYKSQAFNYLPTKLLVFGLRVSFQQLKQGRNCFREVRLELLFGNFGTRGYSGYRVFFYEGYSTLHEFDAL